jgi:hypothetical protein
MNANKNLVPFIVGSLSISLIICLPTFFFQQKKLLDLREETLQLLQKTNPTIQPAYHNYTYQYGQPEQFTPQDIVQSQSITPLELTSLVPTHRLVQETINEISDDTTLESEIINNSPKIKPAQQIKKSIQDKIISDPVNNDEAAIKKSETITETKTSPATLPTQTAFPFVQQPAAPKNYPAPTGPTYDSTMYLPVVINNPVGVGAGTGNNSSGGSSSGGNNVNNNANNSGGNNGGGGGGSIGVDGEYLDDILKTLQFDIPFPGGYAVDNSTTQIRKRSKKRTYQQVWTQPLVIDGTSPMFDNVGIVRFKENIVFKPTDGSYSAAIIIDRNDVTIDLYGFNLELDSSEIDGLLSNHVIHGIFIKPGVKNIKILSSASQDRQGSISRFTGYGIYAEGGTNPTMNAIQIYNNQIKDLEFHNITISECFNGIYLKQVAYGILDRINIIHNTSLINTLYGIYCLSCSNLEIKHCRVNENYSNYNVYGIYLKNTIGCTIKHTEANFNKSVHNEFITQSPHVGSISGMTIIGTSTINSHSNIIFNCQANDNICGTVSEAEIIGFHLAENTFNNVIEQSQASYNHHNKNTEDLTDLEILPIGYGFKIENSHHNQIISNQANSNLNYGFYDDADASTTIYTGNKSFYNPINYDVVFKTNVSETQPLSRITIYPSDLSAALNTISPLVNIEMQAPLS